MNKKALKIIKFILFLLFILIAWVITFLIINYLWFGWSNDNKQRIDDEYSYAQCVGMGWEITWSFPKSCYIDGDTYYEEVNINFDAEKPIPLTNEQEIIDDVNNIDWNSVVESIEDIDISSTQ